MEVLRARAALQDAAALRFVCSEVTWTDEGSRRRTDLLLLRTEDGLLEWRSNPSRARANTAVPPAFAWTLLFSAEVEPFLAFRDVGERQDGFHRLRLLEFRGALPYREGTDVREWEGRLAVDADTLQPVSLEAVPSGQTSRLRATYLRHERSMLVSLTLFGGALLSGRTGPKPIGCRLRIRFDAWQDGIVLPTEAEVDIVRQVSGEGAERRLRTLHRRYENCRRFSTDEKESLRAER